MRKEGNTYHLTPKEARQMMGEEEYLLRKNHYKHPLPPLNEQTPPFAVAELPPEIATQIELLLEEKRKEKIMIPKAIDKIIEYMFATDCSFKEAFTKFLPDVEAGFEHAVSLELKWDNDYEGWFYRTSSNEEEEEGQ